METIQVVDNNVTIHENVFILAQDNNFTEIIESLFVEGVHPDEMGETLFSLAQQAVNNSRFDAAKAILFFLMEALEDKSETPSISRLLGDVFAGEKDFGKAREYYGQLPVTLESIHLCARTFMPSGDIDGLLIFRNQILGKTPLAAHSQIHQIIDTLMKEFGGGPETFDGHFELYQRNKQILRETDPYLIDDPVLKMNLYAEEWETEVVKTSEALYVKQYDGVWSRADVTPSQTLLHREHFRKRENVIFRCQSIEAMIQLTNAFATAAPEFFKHECMVTIDFRLLCQVMTFCDLLPLANCDFLIRFVDESNAPAQIKFLLLEKNVRFPAKFIDPFQENRSYFIEKLKPVLQDCEKEIQKRRKNYEKIISERYPDDFHVSIKRKFEENIKLRVLLRVSRYTSYLQYCIRDMAEGFRQLGHEVFIETEKENAGTGINWDLEIRNLAEFLPDIIFVIGHLRSGLTTTPPNIPVVTWVQDPLKRIFFAEEGSLSAHHDFIYSISTKWQKELSAKPAYSQQNIRLLPMLANTELYHPLPILKKYDVSYVNHLNITEPFIEAYSATPDNDLSEEGLFHRKFLQFTDTLSVDSLSHYTANFFTLSREFWEGFLKFSELKIDGMALTPYDLLPKLTLVMRVRILTPLLKSDIQIALFGNGWDKHPWFQHLAMGPVQNGRELNLLINETRISLNICPDISFHNRVPELAAAKAFFLSRDIGPDDLMPLDHFFKRGNEVVFFKDGEDLVHKITYYLKHEKEREEIADRFHARFLEKFTYKAGARQIIQDIKDRYTNIQE